MLLHALTPHVAASHIVNLPLKYINSHTFCILQFGCQICRALPFSCCCSNPPAPCALPSLHMLPHRTQQIFLHPPSSLIKSPSSAPNSQPTFSGAHLFLLLLCQCASAMQALACSCCCVNPPCAMRVRLDAQHRDVSLCVSLSLLVVHVCQFYSLWIGINLLRTVRPPILYLSLSHAVSLSVAQFISPFSSHAPLVR